MSKRPRSRAEDYFVYLAVRSAVAAVQALPPRWGYAAAGWLARLAHRADRRHREVAADNLRHAFPELRDDPAGLARTVRAVYSHFLRMVVEMAHLPRSFGVANWHRRMRLVNPHLTLSALTADRPLLIVTAHFGNWELAGYILGTFGFRTYAIARTLDNPYLERFFKRFRQKTGQTILAKKGDFDRITVVLGGNGAVATLADQDAGPRGLYVDFFGRPASTHKAVALMSLEYNAPMLVVGVPRAADGLYEVTAEELIFPEEYAGRPDAAAALTRRYTAALERLIRRHPGQYFWLHRRWKHQPKKRAAAA